MRDLSRSCHDFLFFPAHAMGSAHLKLYGLCTAAASVKTSICLCCKKKVQGNWPKVGQIWHFLPAHLKLSGLSLTQPVYSSVQQSPGLSQLCPAPAAVIHRESCSPCTWQAGEMGWDSVALLLPSPPSSTSPCSSCSTFLPRLLLSLHLLSCVLTR